MTGKNVGEIMLKALTLVASSLSTDVTDLNCGEDYDEVILSYDWRTHRSSGASRRFGGGQGSLYIVKPRAKSA